MNKIFRTIAVSLLAIGISSMVFAQDIALSAFSDDTYGVQGFIPDGWGKIAPGIYARQSSPTDAALIAVQSVPADMDTLWQALLPQLLLEEAPESIGTLETEAFSWTLFVVDVEAGGLTGRVDLAMTESRGITYLVLLQATVDDYDTLHESVFLPVVESLTPLEDLEEVPYRVEDVTFTNGDVTLAGTLTIPAVDGQHPAVVLMSGTGPQNRDEIVVPGFRIFRIIADYLTRHGIAVLRYDDRGVGESSGEYNDTSIYDFASDGKAAVAYLQSRADINPEQVGLLGHSEGGVYSAILGADPESGIAFIISMAGTATDGQTMLLQQNELIFIDNGATEEQIQFQLDHLRAIFPLIAERDWDGVAELSYQNTVQIFSGMSAEELAESGVTDIERQAQQNADSFIRNYANESFATLLEYNPADDWARTTVPVLGIFGELDIQVPPQYNAEPMEMALEAAGNEDFSVVIIDGANHLFQDAETGSINEYAVLPYEFSPEFLPLIGEWLLARVDIVK